jgi:SAM-dependent methyltransferase
MDATGAFRLYRIKMISQNLWDQVTSSGYSFFFESLAVLHRAGVPCDEVSIHLPKRVYGESKLNMRQAFRSLLMLIEISLRRDSLAAMRNDASGWDRYWKARDVKGRHWYAVLASVYRRLFIVNRLHAILRNEFPAGSVLIHVGCGGGEVDEKSSSEFQITGVDISPEALALYRHHYPKAKTLSGNILEGPVGNGADGIYSLGLVEHFSHRDIIKILNSMHSSVKVGGKAVIFWPHRFAPSVFVLRIISGVRKLIGWSEPLHPPEPSLLFSQNEAREIISRTLWRIKSYDYGYRDLWIQAALVLEAGV